MLFANVWQRILNYVEMSIGSLRVAGGLLLLLIALQMLRGELDTPIIEEGCDVAIAPLVLPLLAGPGTLTTVMLLMSKSQSSHIGLLVGILAARFVTWLILRLANLIDRWIGAEGRVIVPQLLGFLLAALAVEIASTKIKELYFS